MIIHYIKFSTLNTGYSIAEFGMRKAEWRSGKSECGMEKWEVRKQMTEDGSQRTDDKRQMTNE
jgi:hypothetical protein